MNVLKKYKLRSINYNIISKINCVTLKSLPNNLTFSNLLIRNSYINSPYELITVLFLLKFISNNKPIILKSKKDNVLSGVRKNNSLSGQVILRKNQLNDFYLKIINSYFKLVDFSRSFGYTTTKDNTISFNIFNINKIDKNLFKEANLIKNYKLELVLKQKTSKSSYFCTNNFKLLLSHLKFPFYN